MVPSMVGHSAFLFLLYCRGWRDSLGQGECYGESCFEGGEGHVLRRAMKYKHAKPDPPTGGWALFILSLSGLAIGVESIDYYTAGRCSESWAWGSCRPGSIPLNAHRKEVPGDPFAVYADS